MKLNTTRTKRLLKEIPASTPKASGMSNVPQTTHNGQHNSDTDQRPANFRRSGCSMRPAF